MGSVHVRLSEGDTLQRRDGETRTAPLPQPTQLATARGDGVQVRGRRHVTQTSAQHRDQQVRPHRLQQTLLHAPDTDFNQAYYYTTEPTLLVSQGVPSFGLSAKCKPRLLQLILVQNSPAQVDSRQCHVLQLPGIKEGGYSLDFSVLRQPLQGGQDATEDGVPLGLHVGEGGAEEETEVGGAGEAGRCSECPRRGLSKRVRRREDARCEPVSEVDPLHVRQLVPGAWMESAIGGSESYSRLVTNPSRRGTEVSCPRTR